MTEIIAPTNKITSRIFTLSNQASVDVVSNYIRGINATFALFVLQFRINNGAMQSIEFTKDQVTSGAALTMFNIAIAAFVTSLPKK